MTVKGKARYSSNMEMVGELRGLRIRSLEFSPPLVILFIAVQLAIMTGIPCHAEQTEALFGYQAKPQKSLDALPQWLSVMERHRRLDMDQSATSPNSPEGAALGKWRIFLDSIRGETPERQIAQVNEFANRHKYILDSENYGLQDYWAIVREFLVNNGDCEDYAITKFFSLRLLGFDNSSLRIVILQDTNLRIPHAVVAVKQGDEYLILDNQARQVLQHEKILHYVPIYSMNEEGWWLYLPPMR